ncbi:MAG TPA: DUF469 family protein [Candidatus Fraserbacteria bacterium]|nr:DUF469 family protein [Candidatus Fraserbacteria bacterium]
MKKRLRKKKHTGEFTEWGVTVAIVIRQEADFDHFLDDFIEEAIEGNDCYFGGGGRAPRLEGVIELGRISDDPEEKLRKVIGWLEAREDVERYATGKLIDLWYRPPSPALYT